MTDVSTDPDGMGVNGVVPGCGQCAVCHTDIPLNRLMCARHWRQIPRRTGYRLTAALRRWHRDDATLADLRAAQRDCVSAVKAKEEAA